MFLDLGHPFRWWADRTLGGLEVSNLLRDFDVLWLQSKTAGFVRPVNADAGLLRVYGHMVVKHGFFQSDPHNGNWLLDCKGGSLCEGDKIWEVK